MRYPRLQHRFWTLRRRAGLVLAAGTLAVAASAAPQDQRDEHPGLGIAIGKALFKRNWLPAPSSTISNDGLGPLFNARSCLACHAAAHGGQITQLPDGTLAERGAVVRLARPDGSSDPVYGAQVQTRAIPGHIPEASVAVDWDYSKLTMRDGTVVELRKPKVVLTHLSQGPLGANVTASILLAPSLLAAAQLDRVDYASLGRAATLSASPQPRGLPYGRKGTEASIEDIVGTAFSRDLGMSTASHLEPAGDCTAAQAACLAGPHGNDGAGAEIAPEIVSAIASYVRSLTPAHPRASADWAAGAALFTNLGCAACHKPKLPGKDGNPVEVFSDVALHDMGEGLAGVAIANGASAREWRTAPLLDIDARLAAGATLLHDGRARSVSEAILWHDGQAGTARKAYENLQASERAALEAYIMSR